MKYQIEIDIDLEPENFRVNPRDEYITIKADVIYDEGNYGNNETAYPPRCEIESLRILDDQNREISDELKYYARQQIEDAIMEQVRKELE